MTGSQLFYGDKTIHGFLSVAPSFVRCALLRRSCPEAVSKNFIVRMMMFKKMGGSRRSERTNSLFGHRALATKMTKQIRE
jgi:hypothetical protein